MTCHLCGLGEEHVLEPLVDDTHEPDRIIRDDHGLVVGVRPARRAHLMCIEAREPEPETESDTESDTESETESEPTWVTWMVDEVIPMFIGLVMIYLVCWHALDLLAAQLDLLDEAWRSVGDPQSLYEQEARR